MSNKMQQESVETEVSRSVGKRRKGSRRYRAACEGLEPGKAYELGEAVSLVKERAQAKFDETVDIAVNLGVDPRHADQMVRGVSHLPHGTGRNPRVAVFAKGEKAEAAREAGADIVGEEDLVKQVEEGKIDFERCVATPDMMPMVGRIGKILGPRGLMPNPKTGTVSADVGAAVKAIKGGAVEFRIERNGILHAGVGKAKFSAEQLVENILSFMSDVRRAKPSGAKGNFIERISISSSMGPGVRVDPKSVASSGRGSEGTGEARA